MKNLIILILLSISFNIFAMESKQKNETRIAFGSCVDQDKEQDRIWNKIIATAPDSFVFLGDNIYKDTEHVSEKVIEYEKLKKQPGYITLKKKAKIYTTWDDHDFGLNDSGGEYKEKEESKKLFLEAFDEPKDSIRWKRPGVYDSYIIAAGKKKVQLILLDTRSFRSPLKKSFFSYFKSGPYIGNEDDDATILGAEQWKWLKEELLKPADVRIIASSIQYYNDYHGFEKWGNFPKERKKLLDLLKETKARGIVIVSGDRHIGEYHKIEEKGLPKIYELTTSPLNRLVEFKITEPFHPDRIGNFTQEANFGLVRIFDEGAKTIVKIELHLLSGMVYSIETNSDEMNQELK